MRSFDKLMTKHASSLSISGLELNIYLGWPDNERSAQQVVHLDIDIQYPEPPKACLTDNLVDTICYSELLSEIRHHLQNKKFHLIEHLSYEIFTFIQTKLPNHSRLQIHITKKPKIAGLTGHVRFSYWGDT